MDYRTLALVFGSVFLAELGDKTQLATLLFAARNPQAKWLVFGAASAALVLAAAIGVIAGGLLAQYLDPRLLRRFAGVAFIVIGGWTLWNA
jgi:putative Ca2+/H+ antiporter (TMEM165/GDT1 family)